MMAAQPECRRFGDYVHSGLVVCEECSGILKDEMRALRTELTDATAQINELNEENRRLLAELEAARGQRDSIAKGVRAGTAVLRQENEQMRVALECTYNWAMTDETEPNGGFDIFAEEIIPMIGKVLGRE